MKRLIALIGVLIGGALIWTVASIALYTDPEPIPNASAIVVLSGPFTETEEPKGETRIRVDRGAALYTAGLAPVLVMSGGGSRAEDGPGDAAVMAEYAAGLGVPAEAIRTETNSQSTLQNALFTARLDEVDPAAPILLVTHRYHLSRATLSFRWAGFTDVTAVAADPDAPQAITPWLLLEGLKWPFNALRAGLASIALRAGMDESDVLPWLR